MMLPYPPTFGKRMEIWTSLRALSEAGHGVTLVSFHDPGQQDIDEEALAEVCRDVVLVPLELSRPSSIRDYLNRLAALLTRHPHQAVRYRSAALRKCLERCLNREHYDAVICGEVFMLQNMPAGICVPVILKKDHIAATILRRYVLSERNPVKKLYAWIEYAKTSRWETSLCRRATAMMACSNLERDELQNSHPGIPVTMAPNVVDLEAYQSDQEEDGKTILYHGLMDWFPNQDAVAYFIIEILPRLRRLVPDVRVVVAGRTSSQRFSQRFAHVPGVEFTGTVPDMQVYIRQCAVCIVPLRIASGTRFKILEAAALSRPTVSTRIGAEGLEFLDGSEITLADDPEAFARGIADLLDNPRRRRAMGLAARKRVATEYSFQRLCDAMEKTLALAIPAGAKPETSELARPRK